MAAQTIVVSGTAPARRAASRPVRRGSTSETIGWLLFGGIALAAIYWLTRPKVATGGVPLSPDTRGLSLGFLTEIAGLLPAVDLTVGTVTASSTVAGIPQGTVVPCYDARLASKMLPGEYIDNSGSHPKLCQRVVNGDPVCYSGCPNDVLLFRS